MSLDATPGGISSDSFVDVTTADSYILGRLYTTEWDEASLENKERALKMATVELDRQAWKGTISASTQALRWPRGNVTDLDGNLLASDEIPIFLENATTELAMSLLQSNRYAESESTGIKKVQAGTVLVEFDRKDTNSRNPTTVYQMIAPYTNAGIGNWTWLSRG